MKEEMKKYKVAYNWGPGIWRVINAIENDIINLGGNITHHAWGKAPYTEYELPINTQVIARKFGSGPCQGLVPDKI